MNGLASRGASQPDPMTRYCTTIASDAVGTSSRTQLQTAPMLSSSLQ